MKSNLRNTLLGIATMILFGLNAIGLTSSNTRFASVNDYMARHTTAHNETRSPR